MEQNLIFNFINRVYFYFSCVIVPLYIYKSYTKFDMFLSLNNMIVSVIYMFVMFLSLNELNKSKNKTELNKSGN